MISYSIAATSRATKAAQLPSAPPESILDYLRRLRKMLTPKEVGVILRHHEESIYVMISGGLPATKSHGRWKIDPILLANWLTTQGYVTCVQAQASEKKKPAE